MPWSPSRLAQLLSSASSGQRTLARVTAATAAQAEQDMNNELSLLRKDAKKLELVNANLHEQLEAANANALKEKAAAEAHLAQVVQGLKLVIQELEGQLKQQVRFLNLVF
jgi:histidinol dehydrogenase